MLAQEKISLKRYLLTGETKKLCCKTQTNSIAGVRQKGLNMYKMDEVLRVLGIEGFQYLSFETIGGFASMIPKMDMETIELAMEQCPALKEVFTDLATKHGTLIERALGGDRAYQRKFFDVCDEAYDVLMKKIKGDLSMDEIENIEQRLAVIYELKSMNRENIDREVLGK